MKTEDFDKAFDEGSDLIDDVVQWDKGHRPDLDTKRVNIDFPIWMINALDKEAARLGVARQAIVKTWMAEKLDQARR
ncbi:type II toxin-antitoxin system BrnA family antitoxin [Endozoicomonas sp. ALC020]|uniref:type II toxin-antitoxin system BrnA family antitoxin n=1 Tax=unclassified Endozoicomonas TaxID=2644528 RepID=UPI003BAE2D55